MQDKDNSWMPYHAESAEAQFRPIKPEQYVHLGIDPQDIPNGTFAAQDHPTFLHSRFGGNAYGLGLIEVMVHRLPDLSGEQWPFNQIGQVRVAPRQPRKALP